MASKGWTLIETLIGIAIAGIAVVVIFNGVGSVSNGSTISFGANGMTEVRCINGYQFVIGHGGQARQVLDEFGKGARCEKP